MTKPVFVRHLTDKYGFDYGVVTVVPSAGRVEELYGNDAVILGYEDETAFTPAKDESFQAAKQAKREAREAEREARDTERATERERAAQGERRRQQERIEQGDPNAQEEDAKAEAKAEQKAAKGAT